MVSQGDLIHMCMYVTDDRFNLASIYDSQQNEDDPEVDYNIFPNN